MRASCWLPTLIVQGGSFAFDRIPCSVPSAEVSARRGGEANRGEGSGVLCGKGGSIMPVLVNIPKTFTGLTHGLATVEADGATVSEVLQDLVAKYPGMRDKLYDSEGLCMFIKIDRIKENNRFLATLETSVKDGDQVSILQAVAGG